MSARRRLLAASRFAGTAATIGPLIAPLCGAMVFLLAAAPLTTAPATAPAAAAATATATPAAAVDPALRRLVADLANADDAVRADARDRLLGLPASRLPDLAAAARAARPLLPAQAEILRDVVRHVYLTDLPYERAPLAFLGITMAPEDELVRVRPPGGSPDQTEDRLGVRVTHRWPGFAGYRWLLDGDVIVRVEEFPPEANGATGFREYVRQRRPGDRITLHVLRQGQIIRVPVTLGALPAVAVVAQAVDAIQPLISDRDEHADRYWNTTFAPAIE